MTQRESVHAMSEGPRTGKGMDVIIISAETPAQEKEWQHHFEGALGDLLKPTAKVLSVCEDWEGGAGNGLGTLYALQKAREKGLTRYGCDIFELQKKGASIALYHTAGQGKRLAPLTSSEKNNKSAVKLPGYLGRPKELMTLLDAVIKQTSIYAQSRKGRLSVFWGDQLFIPEEPVFYPSQFHVDILMRSSTIPTSDEWLKDGWDQCGLLFETQKRDWNLLEKFSYLEFEHLANEGVLDLNRGFGKSLGSFSLSTELTFALLDLFKEVLARKKGRLDTDPFFWMPMTLDQDTYLNAMVDKGYSSETVREHYFKMQQFKRDFCQSNPALKFFGVQNIGEGGYWWDYGTVANYFKNNLKLTSQTPEGQVMREFFGAKLDPLTSSVVLGSQIHAGTYLNSIIMNSTCREAELRNCLVLNSTLGKVQVTDSLLYNVQEKDHLALNPGSIRADVFLEERHLELKSGLNRDGKADWSHRLPENSLSYEEVYRLNQSLFRVYKS